MTVRNILRTYGLFFIAVCIAVLLYHRPSHAGTAQATETCANGSQKCVVYDSIATVAARPGEYLTLTTDLGNLIVHTHNSRSVDYHIHLEVDASQKDATDLIKNFKLSAVDAPAGVIVKGQSAGKQCSGRLWATIEVTVPQSYGVEATTGGGSIQVDDLIGRDVLSTVGGNITTGNLRGSAQMRTGGGHIIVKNIAGDLVATTGGGHIVAGTIGGNATLHTNGGHIRVNSVGGVARLQTGGGNVTLQHSGAELVAETSGGQIDVGDAAGLVRAKTGGGGIRLSRASGQTTLQAPDGSIYITQLDGSVLASTGAGGITAWLGSSGNLKNASEFTSDAGDISVYLPRDLPVTIDARILHGTQQDVAFDPAFPLNVTSETLTSGAKIVHAQARLNGGGQVVRLRTSSGKIHLVLSDLNKQIEIYKEQMQGLQQELQSSVDGRQSAKH